MKTGTFSKKDNTPFTVLELRALLNDIPEKLTNKPVLMYSDEEGNSIGKLYAVEVKKDGQVTLTPADAETPE